MNANSRSNTVLRAAELYYLEQWTMDAIADALGCSRATVSRMISSARTSGLVEITVHRHRRAAATLERLIAERYRVEVTVVAPPGAATEADRVRHAASQAATVLRANLAPDASITVAWGATVAVLARSLSPGVIPGLQIVQMSGAGNTFSSGSEYAAATLGRLGAALGGRVHHFPVPAFFDKPATRAALWGESSVQRVLRLQERANVAVFSVSALDSRVPGHLYRAGYLQRQDLRQLIDADVVGELGTVFLRADGSTDAIALNARSSGLPLDALRGIRRRLCVAVGADKSAIIKAALMAGAITDLVVDDTAAETLVS